MSTSVTVVVPAYNEEAAIGKTVLALHEAYPDFELIVVDDGSTDRTSEILANSPCKVITHSPNRGYGATWKTGCRAATGDIVVFYDGDGQFDVKDVGRLLELFRETGSQMTSGARQKSSHTPFVRAPGKAILKMVAKHLSRMEIPDLNCGLRAFDRKTLRGYLSLLPDGFSASTTSMLAFLKRRHKVTFLPIVTKAREGTSSVKILRDGFGAIMLIIRVITLFDPLYVFLPISLFLAVFGVLYSMIIALVQGGGVPVMGATLFLTGVLVFFMGILADQVSATRLQGIERDLERD
jgi:glycosyltransferase involved in cell wall biosynthesis